MKLDEFEVRPLLEAMLRQAEAQEAARANPFAYARLAQRLRDELALIHTKNTRLRKD